MGGVKNLIIAFANFQKDCLRLVLMIGIERKEIFERKNYFNRFQMFVGFTVALGTTVWVIAGLIDGDICEP